MIAFRVFGIAQPKGNMKAYTPRGMKFPIVTERNRSVKAWSQLVAEGASRALNTQEPRCTFFEGAVSLRLIFRLPRPKSIRAKRVPHLNRPDLDKLQRAVLDALTGVLYNDDGQVVELNGSKYYAEPGHPPYVDVFVSEAIDGYPIDTMWPQVALFLEGQP